jgi:putative DNA primase/helicase
MQYLISVCLGIESAWLYMQGTTTEAGLRQSVKGSSIPVIFDEFETTDSESKRRLGALVQLMRNTWSSTGGTVTKGSPNGATINYQLSFPCLVSSIRLWLTNDADVSRFTVLELGEHDRQNDKWEVVKTALDKLDVDFGERLFSYMSGRVHIVLSNYKLLQAELAAQSNQRFGQQIGMLLAGFYALHSESPLTEEEARAAASDAIAMSETEIDADHFECLRHLLTWRFEVFDGGMRTKRSLESILDEELDEVIKRQQYAIVKKDLLSCGIRIEDNRDISIDQSHVEIKRIFRDTRWESSWATSLLRIDGARKKAGIRFGSGKHSQRGIFIPHTALK